MSRSEWTPHKAWAGAISGALVGVLSVLASGVLDDGLTRGEVIDMIVAAVLGSGLVGGTVYRVPNRPKRRH